MDGRSTASGCGEVDYPPEDAALAATATLLPFDPVPAHLVHGAVVRGMARYAVQTGDLGIELRYLARRTEVDVRCAPARALLLIPLTDAIEIAAGGTVPLVCPAGVPFLCAREATAVTTWPAGSWSLAIQFRRDRANAVASLAADDALRLAPVAILLAPAGDLLLERAARRMIATVAGALPPDAALVRAAEIGLYRALVDRLRADESGEALLMPLRSIGEAMRIIRGNHGAAFDTDALATAVGVTAQTLRKGFRTCLGMSVKDYIQAVRLDWAHARLVSGRDSRPVATIAVQAGFARTPPFSRAYLKRFGEPPSQTRARAVHAAR